MFNLGRYGIIGINKRNLDFILSHNARRHFPNADSKLLTKRLAQSAGVRTPELIDAIHWQVDVRKVGDIIRAHAPCVLKPDHGSGGGGIIVIQKVLPVGFQKTSGDLLSESDIRFHCQNMLSGQFSLGSHSDSIVIEKAVVFDPVFDDIAFQGVPDVRLIVLEGKPIMGMLRLPTKVSDGKANLHKGGLGVGVNLKTGITTHAVQFNRYVERHPETGHMLGGRQIPRWEEMLDIAIRMQQVSQLGYVGVDIVLDKHDGPMVLEINARPGISIQIANVMGLQEAVGQA